MVVQEKWHRKRSFPFRSEDVQLFRFVIVMGTNEFNLTMLLSCDYMNGEMRVDCGSVFVVSSLTVFVSLVLVQVDKWHKDVRQHKRYGRLDCYETGHYSIIFHYWIGVVNHSLYVRNATLREVLAYRGDVLSA